ncbi:MAG: hypothetical protein HYT16_02050 [DPANN group archaeon]|nr:hypothetical protein [DPANN group archaeon]
METKKGKCTYESHKSKPAKLWHFLAHEDSWASFVADAVLVILIGKFILFPGLGLVLGTGYPVVAVVSSSMDHHGSGFEQWWFENGRYYESDYNITGEQFRNFYRPDGFVKGDVFVVRGIDGSEAKVGDILVYTVNGKSDPIIHRVIAANPDGTFQTKGDANFGQLPFEKNLDKSKIQGKAVFWIPKIGWVKVLAVEILNKVRGAV